MEEKPRWRGFATEVDFSLWRMLDHARFMIARSREMELSKYNLTPEQSHVLDILRESEGSTTINQLVEITQRQHHSISVLINRMIRLGLLSKTRASGKSRSNIVMTRKGQALLGNVPRLSIELSFASLKSREKARMAGYLETLYDKARNMLGRPVDFTRQTPS
jgi:DNA-binding MarR family transcriptional regulator